MEESPNITSPQLTITHKTPALQTQAALRCLLTWQLASYVGIFILAKQCGSLHDQMLNPRDLSHSGGAPQADLGQASKPSRPHSWSHQCELSQCQGLAEHPPNNSCFLLIPGLGRYAHQ